MYLDLWLESKKMTLIMLARKLNVQRAYLVRMLDGRTRPTPRIAIELERLSEGRIKAMDFLLDPTRLISKKAEEID